MDIALFSAGGQTSRTWAPVAAEAGAWVVDNSSAWRMDNGVALVVPEINGDLVVPVGQTDTGGIIANPNCSTIQIAMAVAPLDAAFGLREVHVTTLQAVSGAGQAAVAELENQEQGIAATMPDGIFPRAIARNVIPAIGAALPDGSFEEETKVVRELRKILGRGRDLAVTCTATRVPVVTGHSAAVRLVCEKPVDLDQACEALEQMARGRWSIRDPHDFATPLEVAGRPEVHVGRLRGDPSNPHALLMWVVADNLLKGAAWNAVQIADLLAGEPGAVIPGASFAPLGPEGHAPERPASGRPAGRAGPGLADLLGGLAVGPGGHGRHASGGPGLDRPGSGQPAGGSEPWAPVAVLVIAVHTLTTTVGRAPGTSFGGRCPGRRARPCCGWPARSACLGLFLRVSPLDDLVAGRELVAAPLARLGLRTDDLGLMLAVALGTAPVVLGEGRRIEAVITMRQRFPPGSAPRRPAPLVWRHFFAGSVDRAPVVVPLLESLARRAEALTLSLRTAGRTAGRRAAYPVGQMSVLVVWAAGWSGGWSTERRVRLSG